jgi:ABC-type transport system substrate-binding protein
VRAALALALALAGCSNDPYPGADAQRKVLYTSYSEPPKTLDPAVSYTTNEHAILGNVYDTLLEYHYLKRPYTLIPGLATEVPHAEPREGGRVAYRFELRPGVLFHEDPCFERGTRAVRAADVAFQLARVADPEVNSPVVEPFSNLVGFREFGRTLAERRESDPAFAARPVHEQYAALGGIEGVRVGGEASLEIELAAPYPQILFWFAMQFTAPVPWEAVAYYDGQEGREHFADHPVGAGPYRLAVYDKYARIALERHPSWYGILHPEWRAPGAVFPDGEGRRLPAIEGVEFRREKESIPAFNKFLQGYYDASGIIRESFDRVVREDHLSPEMAALGMRLEKSVIPAVYYIGFNMDDPVLRNRELRQAMSLVIDAREYTRLFTNGRGVPAQSPLPPGIYGYEASYENPWRRVDLERARRLLARAGYPNGVDPRTQAPLRLTFDTPDTSARGLLTYQFYVDAWRRLGIDVEIAATNYNQFQEKVRNGAYQLFQWGWVADYPDPENFFFLLWSDMARSKSGGPNTANFSDPRFDALFAAMKARENDAERLRVIREMTALLEAERPWIELFHPEEYALYHGWLLDVKPTGMSYPTIKYRDLDAASRARLRAAWNQPVRWPAFALAAAGIAVVIPGVRTFLRERQ